MLMVMMIWTSRIVSISRRLLAGRYCSNIARACAQQCIRACTCIVHKGACHTLVFEFVLRADRAITVTLHSQVPSPVGQSFQSGGVWHACRPPRPPQAVCLQLCAPLHVLGSACWHSPRSGRCQSVQQGSMIPLHCNILFVCGHALPKLC